MATGALDKRAASTAGQSGADNKRVEFGVEGSGLYSERPITC